MRDLLQHQILCSEGGERSKGVLNMHVYLDTLGIVTLTGEFELVLWGFLREWIRVRMIRETHFKDGSMWGDVGTPGCAPRQSHAGGSSQAQESSQTTAEFPNFSWFLEECKRTGHKTSAASSCFFPFGDVLRLTSHSLQSESFKYVWISSQKSKKNYFPWHIGFYDIINISSLNRAQFGACCSRCCFRWWMVYSIHPKTVTT